METDDEPVGELQYKLMDRDTEIYRQKFQWGASVRSRSRYPYNCVGMVFASRRAWIDDKHIQQILEGDYYRRIDRSTADVGDVIVYYNKGKPVHVGVIFSRDKFKSDGMRQFWVVSKWGWAAEFRHLEDKVPGAYGDRREFYTDRPNESTI